METIGIIAGSGVYPATFVRAARAHGVKRIIVSAFVNETDPALASQVEVMEWLRVGQLSRMIKFFKANDVQEAVMVGQIAPKNLFDLRPDLRTILLLGRLKTRNAETIFGAIGAEMSKDGITLLPATTFLEDLMPSPGPVAGPALKKNRWNDVEFGIRIAKEVSRLDIGQTVVVKKGTVLAVEGFEGTNDTIKRGGSLGRGQAMMVKVSKPGQDFRFDVPVVGPLTIQAAADAGVDAIVIEAGKTLLLELDKIRELCSRLSVSLVAAE